MYMYMHVLPPAYHVSSILYMHTRGSLFVTSVMTPFTVVCPALEAPINSFVFYDPLILDESIFEGTQAVYGCDSGHTLVGERFRVCQRDGTFSGEPPSCERELQLILHNCIDRGDSFNCHCDFY